MDHLVCHYPNQMVLQGHNQHVRVIVSTLWSMLGTCSRNHLLYCVCPSGVRVWVQWLYLDFPLTLPVYVAGNLSVNLLECLHWFLRCEVVYPWYTGIFAVWPIWRVQQTCRIMRNGTQPSETDLQGSIDWVRFVVNVALFATDILADIINADHFECTVTKLTIYIPVFYTEPWQVSLGGHKIPALRKAECSTNPKDDEPVELLEDKHSNRQIADTLNKPITAATKRKPRGNGDTHGTGHHIQRCLEETHECGGGQTSFCFFVLTWSIVFACIFKSIFLSCAVAYLVNCPISFLRVPAFCWNVEWSQPGTFPFLCVSVSCRICFV